MATLKQKLSLSVSMTLTALCLGGCASPNPWSQSYVREKALSPDLALAPLDRAPVQVRSIPWDRMEMAMREWETEATKSDVHPEDWDANKKESVKGSLLRNLQISNDPAAISIVGRAGFKTTDTIRPDTPSDEEELRKFARTIGANQVIWASKYVGKADAIVQESVTSYTTGTDWNYDRSDRRRRHEPFSASTTTWVPVRIQKDETAYVAVFLRS
jgi:hypothetical protein